MVDDLLELVEHVGGVNQSGNLSGSQIDDFHSFL